ncbi:bifunctional DNA primase/polymerase [Schaalia hyovaginalis]|uniref:bifunctional DNA primase/polymerase n=1 Tax=Schaalia hyovaginalis TaxID=29316 RepID=UPI0034E935B2
MRGRYQVAAFEAVRGYARAGWKVLPCQWQGPRAKAPLVEGGYRGASCDPEMIARWWERWPRALVGVVPPSGVIVFDVDPRNGGAVGALEDVNGGPLPDTLTVRTGSGGWHLYFRGDPERISAHVTGDEGALAGIDVKHGRSGYVIAPPSIHPVTGRAYVWESLRIPVDMPGRLSQAISAPEPTGLPRGCSGATRAIRRRRGSGAGLSSSSTVIAGQCARGTAIGLCSPLRASSGRRDSP